MSIPGTRDFHHGLLGGLRRRREDGEHEQPLGTGVADTVRRSLGCDQQDSGLHRNLVTFEQEDSLAFEDLVDLVHSVMRVQRMFLPGLERVQPDHHALGAKDRALAHLVRRVDRVVARVDRGGVFHAGILAHTRSQVEREHRPNIAAIYGIEGTGGDPVESPTHINIVLSWFEELKERVPVSPYRRPRSVRRGTFTTDC